MENTETTLFREKNLKKAVEPEQLDGYLKVTGFGPWFVVLAAALVLAAIFVWAFLGKIQPIITGAGYCESGTLICYVAQSEIGEITKETTVDIEGSPGRVTGIDLSLYASSEIPNDVLFLLPEARWYSTVKLSCELEDGLYTVSFRQKAITPASFMTRGD
jgi:hypothetical protein